MHLSKFRDIVFSIFLTVNSTSSYTYVHLLLERGEERRERLSEKKDAERGNGDGGEEREREIDREREIEGGGGKERYKDIKNK